MIHTYLGIDSDYMILGLAVLVVILFILWIVNIAQYSKLNKRYQNFMRGKNGKSMESTLKECLDQIRDLKSANAYNEKNIDDLMNHIQHVYQKMGVVKYDALHEMGGKLSFSLALLNEKEDGFVLNAMHTREGCYTYIKEIVAGNSIILLSDEEQEALEMAKNVEIKKPRRTKK